jgi:AcrR family transcriptional regulator
MTPTLDQSPPLLSIPPDHQPLTIRINGLDVAVLSWAAIPRAKADAPAALLHFSAVGPYAQLKAIWAHLLHIPMRIVALPIAASPRERLRASRLSPLHGRYRTHWNAAPLPHSGQSHLSITHDVALDAAAGSGVALLQPLHHPLDAELFVALLDRRLALPLPSQVQKPTIAGQLWANAIGAGAITALPAFGCQAHWLAAEHPAWPQLVVAALRGLPLSDVPPPAVTTHGSAHTVGVAITAVDDEDASAEQL